MNEIDWLDKVRQNFSEEQFYKDRARFEENNLYGAIATINGSLTGMYRDANLSGMVASSNPFLENIQPDMQAGAYYPTPVDPYAMITTSSGYAGDITVSNGYPSSTTVEAVYDPHTGQASPRQIYYSDDHTQLSYYGGNRYIRSTNGMMSQCETDNGDVFRTNSTSWVRIY